MAKILITGITGLVGSAFTSALIEKRPETRFVALVRRGRGSQTIAERVQEAIIEQCAFDGKPEAAGKIIAAIEFVEGDIADPEIINHPGITGVDTIFHCAADVNLGKDPDGRTFNTNIEGTRNLLAVAQKLEVEAFHYVSTAYVAGTLQGKAPEDGLVADGFHNAYEKSKFESEKLVRESGIPFTIYRPSIVVGRLSDGKIRKPLAFYRLLYFLAKLKRHHCAKRKLDPRKKVTMPLRLEAIPSENVYFVPIDYVQRSITELFLKPVANRCYHITGDSPTSTKMIEEVVAETLQVEGVSVHASVENPSMDEKLVQRMIGDLLPYFSSRAVFDVSNVLDALGRNSIGWKLDKKNLKTLIGNFFQEFFPELNA